MNPVQLALMQPFPADYRDRWSKELRVPNLAALGREIMQLCAFHLTIPLSDQDSWSHFSCRHEEQLCRKSLASLKKTGGFYHAGRILNPTNPIRLWQRGEKLAYQASALSISEFPTIRDTVASESERASALCLHKM